jgi:3-methylcrotonyl-CoA carboxylase alpha subunit
MADVIRKVLIANRGEIAVRIIRTCRAMGIKTVAICSDADRNSLHTRLADETVPIGGTTSLESYLNIPAVIDALRESGADAVHPGYGFLAESAMFARAVVEAGAVWIGPPAAVIELMGDKVRAKDAAVAVGVPIVPGYNGGEPARMLDEARRLGFPVMLKAAGGGGGKGMRAVHHAAEFDEALAAAQREAQASFGDSRVFVEKLIVRPRHVEIQVLADAHGHAIYLGERDCSVQRRHQKVVEEAPSPAVTPELRRRMGEAAVRLARHAGYISAGTVEFLLSGEEFYFLEMNTRIQVEHPVTEMVTGLDLVRLQIEIANGERLPISQEAVQLSGHSIEARIYAEEPERGFLPATGTIRVFEPPGGSEIRTDSGIVRGDTVTPYYDPMLAKLIVHASTRLEAVNALTFALASFRIEGVGNNLAFLSWLIRTPVFRAGDADIEFLDRTWRPDEAANPPLEALVAAALARGSERMAVALDPWRSTSGWRQFGMARSLRFEGVDGTTEVCMWPESDGWTVESAGRQAHAVLTFREGSRLVFEVDGRRIEADVSVVGRDVFVTIGDEVTRLVVDVPGARPSSHGGAAAGSLTAPMPGVVVKVSVAVGDRVEARQPLIVLEAMKMEHVVTAPHAGVVREILFDRGEMVAGGAELIRLEEAP